MLFRSDAYEQLLGEQLGALRTAARFVGGVYVNRDRKGSPDGRDPIVPVEAERQRDALSFVLANAFSDSAWDLRPEVLRKLASDKQRHWGNPGSEDEAFGVQGRIAQIQAFAVLYLLNPGVLQRVYDNELRTDLSSDAMTLPELMDAVCAAGFGELMSPPSGSFSARAPMISNLRRNLQSMLVDRLCDLAVNPPNGAPAPVQALALLRLQQLDSRMLALEAASLDPYTAAHVSDLHRRIDRAMSAITVAE